jgi:chromate transport protein ChrA
MGHYSISLRDQAVTGKLMTATRNPPRRGDVDISISAWCNCAIRRTIDNPSSTVVSLMDGFFRAGALVFGGGHVVLPLLQAAVVPSATAGVSAGVVGILLSALYDPIWTSAIHSHADFGLALVAFALLMYARVSPIVVVIFSAAAGWALGIP